MSRLRAVGGLLGYVVFSAFAFLGLAGCFKEDSTATALAIFVVWTLNAYITGRTDEASLAAARGREDT